MINQMKVNFTGDISFTGIYRSRVIAQEEIFDDEIIKVFNGSDYNVVNLEGPATDSTNYLRNNGKVVSPHSCVDYLSKRNISHFNLANNHMFDNGVEGYLDTIRAIKENHGSFFGAGMNIQDSLNEMCIELNGIRIGMIGVCHREGMISGKNNPGVLCIDNNFKLIREKVKELKKRNNWVIINYHGGEEYTFIPMPSRRNLLRRLSKLDCDIVIAHHSHTFQGYEKYNGKHIFYSLGNFVFDIDQHRGVEKINYSYILSFLFQKESYSFDFFPVYIDVEKGVVKSTTKEEVNRINKLSAKINQKYYINWFKESYRAFFNARKMSKGQIRPRRNQTIFSLIKDKKNIIRFISLLKSKNKRPLFVGAIAFKILNKFNLLNEES